MARCSYLKSVAVVFFAAVCAYLGAWLFPSLSGRLQTAPAAASAETHIGMEGIALRRETALCLPHRAVFLPRDGERIPAGSLLWQGAESDSYVSGKSSVFMAFCDGFEYLAPPAEEKLGMAELSAYLSAPPLENPGSGKLVEGFYWYYAALAPAGCPIPAGSNCYLRFEGFVEYIQAFLVSCEESSEGSVLLFRLRLGDPACFYLRKCKAELLVSGFVS